MVRYRPGTPADSRSAYDIFVPAIEDLGRRTGGTADSTAELGPARAWERRKSLFDHLAATGERWWFAEDEATGQAVGYARSIVRDGVRELTEFFVLPEAQGAGVGRGLLERVFPADGARHRSIVATLDPRAIARYARTGLAGRLPMIFVEAAPRAVSIPSDLVREPIDPGSPPFDELGRLDRALLGFRRDEDHAWLAAERPGWLYRRTGQAVAYGYGPSEPGWSGPYAAFDADDVPVLLADAESHAAATGQASIEFDLALTARTALDHLLARGFRVDPFLMLLFTDGPVDGMDRYVLTAPPFFL
jgi:GNAT superfamily N-acetyltransferase